MADDRGRRDPPPGRGPGGGAGGGAGGALGIAGRLRRLLERRTGRPAGRGAALDRARGGAPDRGRDGGDRPESLRDAPVLRRPRRGERGGRERRGADPSLPRLSRPSLELLRPQGRLRRGAPSHPSVLRGQPLLRAGRLRRRRGDPAAPRRRRVSAGLGPARDHLRPRALRRARGLPDRGRRKGPGRASDLSRSALALHERRAPRARAAEAGRPVSRGEGPRRRDADARVPARAGAVQGADRSDRRAADRGREDLAGLPGHGRPRGRLRGLRDRGEASAAAGARDARGPGLRRGPDPAVHRGREGQAPEEGVLPRYGGLRARFDSRPRDRPHHGQPRPALRCREHRIRRERLRLREDAPQAHGHRPPRRPDRASGTADGRRVEGGRERDPRLVSGPRLDRREGGSRAGPGRLETGPAPRPRPDRRGSARVRRDALPRGGRAGRSG